MDGKDCRVNREVERVLKEFHAAGKPIGCVDHARGGVLPGMGVSQVPGRLPVLRV